MYKTLLTFLLLALLGTARAQTPDTAAVKPVADSAVMKRDAVKPPATTPKRLSVVKQYSPDSTHSPRKAVMHSLMIPGWGQAYNHKWWKVPIIYGGIGLLGSAIVFNQKYYTQFLAIAKYRRKGEQPAPGDKYYTEYQLYAGRADDAYIENAVNAYRRNRDLSILGVLGAWGIQMIDAYIDAKFIQAYSMDDNLSFKVTPSLISQPMYAGNFNATFIPTIKVTLAF